jgi:hypothetical protein
MPVLAFDKFIPVLIILLIGIGVCLTFPRETLLLLKILFIYVTWPLVRTVGAMWP